VSFVGEAEEQLTGYRCQELPVVKIRAKNIQARLAAEIQRNVPPTDAPSRRAHRVVTDLLVYRQRCGRNPATSNLLAGGLAGFDVHVAIPKYRIEVNSVASPLALLVQRLRAKDVISC